MPDKNIPAPTFRKEWQGIKKAVAACGIDLASATKDKPGFGKAVTAFEAEVEKYMNATGDAEEKHYKKCSKLGKAAVLAGAKYMILIHKASEDIVSKVKAGTATPEEIKAEQVIGKIDMRLIMLARNMTGYSKKYLK